MSEVLLAFKDANGNQKPVSAANPLPISGGTVADPAETATTNALLQALIDRIGAPTDPRSADTLIGLLKRIAHNTRPIP